ncbi:carboxypeptidase-like regulatory domain-containing protein [Winogradskyella sp. DF17]|uniref:Carboxypeptidase-like regulatory domain-containing protein n=1 Tax=Winogradskyella pelagia TaxID=2819984 RepID=A0ABS3SYY0_9FLAO|nr:carboxypeptidase-like regulatory domain-containing protein [Winogradskyella sp. DF17]MBO3115697.1 carboxypeptidase-like regulatory domain-containing protein [Winogradskyella sp. DF17]
MRTVTFFLLVVLISALTLNGQSTFSSRVLDATTDQPIPYATIQFNSKNGVITNDNGEYSITISRAIRATDSLIISCLGYEKQSIPLLNYNNEVTLLNPKVVDLEEVLLTNKNYTIDEILEKIKAGLATNYDTDYAKRKLFYRESYYNNIDKSVVNIKKSSIPEINQQLVDSLLNDVPKTNSNHVELLGNLYGKFAPQSKQKMDILKACRLQDEASEVNLENYEKRFNAIFKKYVKRDSYFKIKSGWFSTKEEIDSSLFGDTEKASKEKEMTDQLLAEKRRKDSLRKAGFLNFRKMTIHRLENDHFVDEENDLNFLHKSNRYEFEIEDYAFMNDMFVYVISFKPKRREDYKGTMYVNTEDFAVVRVDYQNVKPLRKFRLLGISLNEYLKEGTIIFHKNDNDKYSIKYIDESSGQSVGIKRPIKIIEKNKNVKGRRQQNMVKGDIDFIVTNLEKTELIVFETESLAEKTFNDFKEKANVLPEYLKKYNPEFWKGYNIIEPNQAIKEFKAIDSE